MGNDHGRPKDIVGEVRQAFTSTADTAFDVCLENQLFGRSEYHPEATVSDIATLELETNGPNIDSSL